MATVSRKKQTVFESDVSDKGLNSEAEPSLGKAKAATLPPRSEVAFKVCRIRSEARRAEKIEGYCSHVDPKSEAKLQARVESAKLRVCHKLTTKLKREIVLGSTSFDDPAQFIKKLKTLTTEEELSLDDLHI